MHISRARVKPTISSYLIFVYVLIDMSFKQALKVLHPADIAPDEISLTVVPVQKFIYLKIYITLPILAHRTLRLLLLLHTYVVL